MAEFTYVVPYENEYHRAILIVLRKDGHTSLLDYLRNAKCSINATSTFSRRRWNGVATSIIFQIPLHQFEIEISEEDTALLVNTCNQVMPLETGLDVLAVGFSPLLGSRDESNTLEDDLVEITDSLQTIAAEFPLPEDIMNRGRQMTEVYLYVYTVENYLRLFIEKIGLREYGSAYVQCFNVPRNIRNSITSRKEQESRNQWIGIRGDSDLFYLDFADLGDLITNNWEVFKHYFPTQAWISTKLDELADCRHRTAHNSFLGTHERDVIRTNFRSILLQLNSFMA